MSYGDINLGQQLQWRHNGRDGVSNHQPRQCLLNCLLRRRSKKTPKLRVTGLCAWNSPVTGEFPIQMASNAEDVSIWWLHHDWLRKWPVAWPPQAITWTKVDLSSVRSHVIHLMTQSYGELNIPVSKTRLKIVVLKSYLDFRDNKELNGIQLNRHQTIFQTFLNFFLNLTLPGVRHLYKQLPNGQYLSDLCKMCNLDANLWKRWIGDHRILTYIFKWERLNTAGHSHSVSIGHWVAPLHND